MQQPVRGFEVVWRQDAYLRERIGWATMQELGGVATIQDYALGGAFILTKSGTMVQARQDTFEIHQSK